MTGSLIISMPIGQKNDGGASIMRRTDVVDIYSKAKGLLMKMRLLDYFMTQLLGVLIVGQVARVVFGKER